MDPVTIAMLGSTALSSIMGGIGTGKANEANQRIAMLNYYEQQAARQQAAAEANRQRSEAHMGQTDAAGNRTYFIPGQGWVTDLSPEQQEILNASEAEQMRGLTSGAQRAEQLDARSVGRRNREDTLATEAERELRGVQRPDEEGLRQLLLARGAEQRNRQSDAVGDQISRQAIRAGGGANAAELLTAARGASDQASARQAGVDATLAAREGADAEFNQKRDAATSMYDYFRRASTTGAQAPQGYMPTGPQKGSTGVADQASINLFARPNQMDYTAPNNAMAGTMSDLTSGLQGYFNSRETQKMNDAILKRWGSNTGAIS